MHPSHANYLKQYIYGNSLGIKDSDKTVEKIVQDLNSNNPLHFDHCVRDIPHTGLCICGVFNLETTADQYYHQRISGEEYDYLYPIFIHLIPVSREKDVLAITYEKRKEDQVKIYLKSIFEDAKDAILKQLSDLLFLQVENWICSTDFYFKNIQPREEYIVKLIENTVKVWDEIAKMNFNIFRN